MSPEVSRTPLASLFLRSYSQMFSTEFGSGE